MKRPLLFLLVCLFSLTLVVGCVSNDRGVSPDPGKIHYPLSLKVHPSGKYLYVLNTNFDLAFSGGSVMVLDTTEKDKQTFNINNVKTELYTLKTLNAATVQVGSFGAQMILNRDGTKMYLAVRQDQRIGSRKECKTNADCNSDELCQFNRCEYRQLTDSSSITILSVDADKTDNTHLKCDQIAITKEQTGGVGAEYVFEQDPSPVCGDTSKIFLEGVKCENDTDCKSGENCDTSKGVCTGSLFPFDLALNQVCESKACAKDADCGTGATCTNKVCVTSCSKNSDCDSNQTCDAGKCKLTTGASALRCGPQQACPRSWQSCKENKLYISHIDYRGVSFVDLKATSASNPVGSWTFRPLTELPINMTSLSLLPAASTLNLSNRLFMASRSDQNMYVLPPVTAKTANEDILRFRFDHASFESTTSANADMRGVALGVDKHNKWTRMYVASRSPASILVYNVQVSATTRKPELLLVGSVAVGSNPSHVVYRPRPGNLPDLLYVVCAKERRVDVIDTQSLKVIHRIKVGEQPYFIALYDPDFNDPRVKVRKRRAYVANFLDTSISVIDLESHRVIGRVTGVDTSLKLSP
jgi:YVTN family beta-propeller protein